MLKMDWQCYPVSSRMLLVKAMRCGLQVELPRSRRLKASVQTYLLK